MSFLVFCREFPHGNRKWGRFILQKKGEGIAKREPCISRFSNIRSKQYRFLKPKLPSNGTAVLSTFDTTYHKRSLTPRFWGCRRIHSTKRECIMMGSEKVLPNAIVFGSVWESESKKKERKAEVSH